MKRSLACLVLLMGTSVPAEEPAGTPADPTLDWLMEQAVAATQPTTQPAASSPFVQPQRDQGVPARITFSDGTVLVGRATTTPGKPLRVWDEDDKQYRDVPLNLITSLTSRVLWERQQEEWQFRESGSDIKVFTGRSYPARETEYAVELVNGQEIIGGIVAPLYLDSEQGRRTIVLHKRAKGETGQSLDDLVYVRRIEFGADVMDDPTE